jgi:hypothetical protein
MTGILVHTDMYLINTEGREMKVIFLDIDGVLNNIYSKTRAPSGVIGIDDDKVKRLRKIVEATGAKLVLTSTWKKDTGEDRDYMLRKLGREKLHILMHTVDEGRNRWEGIRRWMDRYGTNLEAYVILDDELFPDYYSDPANKILRPEVKDHLVRTELFDKEGGLSESHVEEAVRILNSGKG